MKLIYMDHSATTKISDAAFLEMSQILKENYGNPSAVHSLGQEAKAALDKYRSRIAKCIGALPTEIYFTSGGTESDNWIIRSVCEMKQSKGKHIITTAIEHNAVLKTCMDMESKGYEVTYLKPDRQGRISPKQLENAIRDDTILISIMLANNVVGTILDIPSLSAVAKKHRILFHTDAVQAVGHIPVNVRHLNVDFLSLSAHKFNGPKGVGLLYSRLPNHLKPIFTGGGQEWNGRSGTENLPGIAAMTVALEENIASMDKNTEYLNCIMHRVTNRLLGIPGVHQTGDPVNRLPGFCSFVVEDIPHSVMLVNALNQRGICVSSGSACSAASKEASHVITALGYVKNLATCSLRISLGMDNTMEEVDYAIESAVLEIDLLRANTVSKTLQSDQRTSNIKKTIWAVEK